MKPFNSIALAAIFMLSLPAIGMTKSSDSTRIKADSLIIIKTVKVEKDGETFWVVYENVNEIIMLCQNDFKIIKSSKKIINLNRQEKFWLELLRGTAYVGLQWLSSKRLKLLPED